MKFLTPDDIAKMLNIPRRSVIDILAKQPGFPISVTGNRKPRWSEESVLEFFRAKQIETV